VHWLSGEFEDGKAVMEAKEGTGVVYFVSTRVGYQGLIG
jgi:hypothetical protein